MSAKKTATKAKKHVVFTGAFDGNNSVGVTVNADDVTRTMQLQVEAMGVAQKNGYEIKWSSLEPFRLKGRAYPIKRTP
jgi:hypothetical protein